MALILNQSQAQAIYNNMCELNNVGGRVSGISFYCESNCIDVHQTSTDFVHVNKRVYKTPRQVDYREHETYAGQAAFATAYGLS